jgi:hypothetical protein
MSIEVTALGVYNGNGMDLDAYASISANDCNVSVAGQVSGGLLKGAFDNWIGISADSQGYTLEDPPVEAEYQQVNYVDGTYSETGGGQYPC